MPYIDKINYKGTEYDIQDSKLKEELEKLSDVVDTKIGFINKKSVTYFNKENEGVWGDSGLAKTRRWFFDKVISAGTYIDKLNFGIGQSTNPRIVNVEIWEKSSDTLTKKKTVAVDTQSETAGNNIIVFTATLDYTTENDCMVAVLCAEYNSIIYRNLNTTTNTIFASTDASTGTSTLSYSTLATWYMDVSVTLYTIVDAIVNVVTIGNGMDYEEIQDALVDIDDDSAIKPYTLLVMPKGIPYKPFSMVRSSFSDNYPWSGISPRHISIIGLDKEHCVIQSDSGDYKYPCGEPLTNGVIKNLTFVMTNDEQTATATQGGYCLHIDCQTLSDVGYDMTIENCDFEDASAPCLGIGIHENCNLKIKRCNFKTTLSASYNPHEGYRNLYDFGCIFAHTSTLSSAQNQKIAFEDCVGTCEADSKSLWITSAGDYDPETASFEYTLLRNVFWNISANAHGYVLGDNLTANPMNYGNNNS